MIAVMRANQARPRAEVCKSIRLGRLAVTYRWRSSREPWGRFGGGWNWKLGVQAGGGTVILALLVCSLRFTWTRPAKGER